MMKKIAALLLLLSAAPVPAAAVSLAGPDEVPVRAAPWSARAAAMGNGLYGSPEDAVRYNPAWLAAGSYRSISATGGSIQPRRGSFAALTSRFNEGRWGWGIGFASAGSSFDNYVDAGSAARGAIDVSQSVVTIGIGAGDRAQTRCIGLSGNAVVDRIDSDFTTAYGFDAGAGWVIIPHLNAAVVLSNALVAGGETSEDRPRPSLAAGVSWQPPILLLGQSDDPANTLELAVKQHPSSPPSLSAGWESVFFKTVGIRAGVERENPSAGVGFSAGRLRADAAVLFKGTGTLYFLTIGWELARPEGRSEPGPVIVPAVPLPGPLSPDERERNGASPADTEAHGGKAPGEPDAVPAKDPENAPAAAARRAAEEDAAFQKAADAERAYARIAGQAERHAARGYYRAAALALGQAETIPGMTAARIDEARALVRSYEYVGKSRSRENMAAARRLMEARSYRDAAACMERVKRFGYGGEEAELLAQRLNGLMTSGDIPDAAAVEKEMAAAEKLYARGQYREARRALLKVLAADPGNRRARELLDAIYGIGEKGR